MGSPIKKGVNLKNISIIYWSPRILAIIFILFLALFSLDIFDMGLNSSEIAVGLLMHNIPSLILLLVLSIAWKIELVGGIVFTLAGLAYIGLIVSNRPFEISMLLAMIAIAGPTFLIGILFFLNWYKKNK